MHPRRMHEKPKQEESEEEVRRKWKDELPPAIWRVWRDNFEAHFTVHKGKVVKADRQIEVLLGLRLMPALEACWDKGCKTALLPPEGKP